MSVYTVKTGDTFESISRSQFGVEDKALTIISANPGVLNPPSAGSVLFIPKVIIPTLPRISSE